MSTPSQQSIELLHESALNIGYLASYSEKTEHLEPRDNPEVLLAPGYIIKTGSQVLTEMGFYPFDEYVQKIKKLEEKNFHSIDPNAPKLTANIDASTVTWLGLQTLQSHHDNFYHPDVVNPGPRYHLNHTVLHLTKSSGYILGNIGKDTWLEVAKPRLTDMIIFGIKAATALHIELPDSREYGYLNNSQHKITR